MDGKALIKKLIDTASHLTNLEVTTYTGKLEQAVDATTGKIQWDAFEPTNGKLVLVAATLIRPNLETVNFRAEGLEHGDLEALARLHAAAVESAQNGRLALAKMLVGLASPGEDA